jgi:hypothetical protein
MTSLGIETATFRRNKIQIQNLEFTREIKNVGKEVSNCNPNTLPQCMHIAVRAVSTVDIGNITE